MSLIKPILLIISISLGLLILAREGALVSGAKSVTPATAPDPSNALTITPANVSMSQGATQIFTATITGQNQGLSWHTTGGMLSSNTGSSVTFTAASNPGTYTITVTSQSNSRRPATATVTVTASPITPFSITNFDAGPQVVDMGSSSTLSWDFVGLPTSLSIMDDLIGTSVSVMGQSTNLTVTPIRRQTWRLSGSNLLGSSSRQITTAARGIDRLAGFSSPSPGYVDGMGTAARFGSILRALACDAAGNVYVADSNNAVIRRITPAGTVSTIAGFAYGTELTGFSVTRGTTDGPANKAQFNFPLGIATTPNGTIYISDFFDHVIRKVSPDGQVTTLAGTAGQPGNSDGPGAAARFSSPMAVTVDVTGNIYVADADNHAIRKISPGGLVTTLTNQASGSSYGIAVDSSGHVYVSDASLHTIRKISPQGVVTAIAGQENEPGHADGAGGAASFRSPGQLTIDRAGNLYVADMLNSTVRKITPVGVVSTIAGLAQNSGSVDGNGAAARFSFPGGIAIDGTGSLYVGDGAILRKIQQSSQVSTFAGGAFATTSIIFQKPTGIAVDTPGNAYVVNSEQQTIEKITKSGIVSTLAGSDGNAGSSNGVGSSARFNFSSSGHNGIAVDTVGNLFVADTLNHTIRKVTASGVVTTIAGHAGAQGSSDGVGTAARFRWPSGIAIDTNGNLFVTDYGNKTIRKITPSSEVTTVAGTTGVRGCYHDPGATTDKLCDPTGIAVDGSGALFITEPFNQVVKRVIPGGNVTIVAGSPGLVGSLDGAGDIARFNSPLGLSIDQSGNLFVTDSYNSVVRRITTGGMVSTIAGQTGRSGIASSPLPGILYEPKGIAVNESGDLLVTSLDGVVQITAPGDGLVNEPLIIAPSMANVRPGQTIQFSANADVIWRLADGNGTIGINGLYTAPGGLDRVTAIAMTTGYPRRYTSAEVQTIPFPSIYDFTASTSQVILGESITLRASYNGGQPFYIGVIRDQAGTVVIDNVINGRDYTLTPTRNQTYTLTVSDALGAAVTATTAVSVITDPVVIASFTADPYAVNFGQLSRLSWNFKGTPRTMTLSDNVTGTFIDLIGEENTRTVFPKRRQIWTLAAENPLGNSSRTLTTVVRGIDLLAGDLGGQGNVDGANSEARFAAPGGLAMDPSGNIYIADTNNHTIRKMTPGGYVMTLAGKAGQAGNSDGAGADARFRAPRGVAVDSSGFVYVADSENQLIRKIDQDGVVTTIAGMPGQFGGTDGVGSDARFFVPNDVTVDGAGNIYVADSSNNTIRKISPDRTVSTLAGTPGVGGATDGPGPTARFRAPSGITSDEDGNLFVADTGNCLIRAISRSGVVTTFAGTRPTGTTVGVNCGNEDGIGTAARFRTPFGIRMDSFGDLFVADTFNQKIRKITRAAEVTTLAGSPPGGYLNGPAETSKFQSPIGVAVDQAGNIIVADSGNNVIRRISGGDVTTLAGAAALLGEPVDGAGVDARFGRTGGVAVASDGNAFVTDTDNHSIRGIKQSGFVWTAAGTPTVPGTGNFRFNGPEALAVDHTGALYIADTQNHGVRKVIVDPVSGYGSATTLAGSLGNVGSTDGTGSAARFNSPGGIAVDNAQNVYVADTGNGTIRKIASSGVVTTLAGSAGNLDHVDGQGSFARFGSPNGIALDSSGNLYVADTGYSVIRKVAPDGTVTTIAGSPGESGFDDGQGSAARFNAPLAVAVDINGNIYVADTGNSTIRKITPQGMVTTIAGRPGSVGAILSILPGVLAYPRGIGITPAGDLIVSTARGVVQITDP